MTQGPRPHSPNIRTTKPSSGSPGAPLGRDGTRPPALLLTPTGLASPQTLIAPRWCWAPSNAEQPPLRRVVLTPLGPLPKPCYPPRDPGLLTQPPGPQAPEHLAQGRRSAGCSLPGSSDPRVWCLGQGGGTGLFTRGDEKPGPPRLAGGPPSPHLLSLLPSVPPQAFTGLPVQARLIHLAFTIRLLASAPFPGELRKPQRQFLLVVHPCRAQPSSPCPAH